MLVTKHAAELCTLLVNDLFGELSSRVLAMLLSKGRSTLAQLLQYTALSHRQLRHGLAVLLQQNLLYHQTDLDSMSTSYEANPEACYNIIRSGKIIEMIGTEYGVAEQQVVETILLFGHASISELIHSLSTSNAFSTGGATQPGSHQSDEVPLQTSDGSMRTPLSTEQLTVTLCRLVRAEIIDVVGPRTFQNPDDVFREIESEIMKAAPGERPTARQKAELHETVIKQLRDIRDESKRLKRQLQQGLLPATKRRRVANGAGSREYLEDIDELDHNIVIKVNYEKCSVELRNHRLTQFVADALGAVTGEVYRTVLKLLTQNLSRCRLDPRLDQDPNRPEDSNSRAFDSRHQATVTSLEVFDHLPTSVNVATGIGKAPRERIDFRSAERIRTSAKHGMIDSEDSDMSDAGGADDNPATEESELEGEQGSDDDEAANPSIKSFRSQMNPIESKAPKVKFEVGAATKDNRFDQLRQHLLLLAESKHGFLRHCGSQGRGMWTVDFGQLMDDIRQIEIDAIIEQSFGRHGLRLTRILRQNGKLDEKALPLLALMKKPDVQGKMLAMQMAGFVDIQEVPRDNNRTANRTMFFWFFDGERIEGQLVDHYYKTMVRCLQTLEVQRHRDRQILSFVERKDVKGKEQEVMTPEHYNKYTRYLELQAKLLGHVMRLDDLVAIFKDF